MSQSRSETETTIVTLESKGRDAMVFGHVVLPAKELWVRLENQRERMR